MPAGRHPQSLAQHPAPGGLLLMLWTFFKPFQDGDPSRCLGNLSWAAPRSQGGGFPKSPTRIYKAVLGAHSSREGGHCPHLSGQATFMGHNQHEMALLGAPALCLSPSEAAQLCLLTDAVMEDYCFPLLITVFPSNCKGCPSNSTGVFLHTKKNSLRLAI